MPDSGDPAGRTLTPRERDVLTQAARGLSNREIGIELHIAEQTVKNHLSSAMRKLSVRDRTHAVVYAIGSGLISVGVSGPIATGESELPPLADVVVEPAAD